jgi:hypothetical protein
VGEPNLQARRLFPNYRERCLGRGTKETRFRREDLGGGQEEDVHPSSRIHGGARERQKRSMVEKPRGGLGRLG